LNAIAYLYGDGTSMLDGLIGAWAWVHVNDKDERVAEASGIVHSDDVGRARTNSHYMEVLALLLGLEALPDRWSGTVRSDSQGALKVISGQALGRIPMPWATRIRLARRRLGSFSTEWVRGHPNHNDLANGHRYGVPVSVHNVYVDLRCRDAVKCWLHGSAMDRDPIKGAWSWW
jgi:ribonuclease HI